MAALALAALLVSPLGAAASGDRDPPFAADAVTYLDGQWEAVAIPAGPPPPPPVSSACKFTPGQDFHSKTSNDTGHPVPSTTKEECCGACHALGDDCVAATFDYQTSQCWVKNAQDASGGGYMRKGPYVGCLKTPSPPPSPSPPAPTPPASFRMKGSVPGDLITDLENAGLIGDPIYELNFRNAILWDNFSWTYSTTFDVSDSVLQRPAMANSNGGDGGAAAAVLVFDGVKMGARVSVNGQHIGTCSDQFRRYVFPLPGGLLRSGARANTVEVAFDKAVDCEGRWQACTGGWDWAPRTTTKEGGAATFTKGIWKSVYVATVSTAAITHIVPQIFYQGKYPTEPLQDGAHGRFTVRVVAHLWAPAATSGTLSVASEWGAQGSTRVLVPAGDSTATVSVSASAEQVKLWWPSGMGEQNLYNVTATFAPSGNGGRAADAGADESSVSAMRRVGFRFFALVTGNDTDASWVEKNADGDGTATLGMMWRINGAAVLARGANMIPMDELEGRLSAAAHRQLVRSAADGGLNTLRVWGGGMFLPDSFYDAADEFGIMIYHDMQYAQQGHSPQNTTDQDAELRHQIRRLSHHPAIVMWDGCNECHVIMNSPTAIYATFVMTVVAQEDASRPVWPSCPASGWTTGVNTLTSIPNGKTLTTPTGGPHLETHGPYQHGGGFQAANGNAAPSLFDPHIPITGIQETPTGLGQPNVFASEFGCSVFSSFESMSPTLEEKHWGVHAGEPAGDDNPMSARNYPCDNIISVYFGNSSDFDQVGETVFQKHLWQCMVGQALNIKQNIETRRWHNQFGIIVWQFNEIWPTGGWGSIEYGTVGFTKGQVLGGRWKPLQHWYAKTIYTDVMATCGLHSNASCYVANDAPKPFSGTVTVDAVTFSTGAARNLATLQLDMEAGLGAKRFFDLPQGGGGGINGTFEMLHAVVKNASGSVVNDNWIPFAPPGKMQLPDAKVTFSVSDGPGPDGRVKVTVTSDKFALFVTLTTLAQGRFSDNAFCMMPGSVTVDFIPLRWFNNAGNFALLKSSLRLEHAAMYAPSRA